MLSDTYSRIDPRTIQVDREKRQRSAIDTLDLVESIKRNGIINPLVVTRSLWLVAGERRLQSALELGLATVPCRFAEDLAPEELQIIELEENLKRKDYNWQDTAKAISRIHSLYCQLDPQWTQLRTSEAICLNAGSVARYLAVASEMDNPKVRESPTMNGAYNLLTRRDAREEADAISEIIEAGAQMFRPSPQAEPSALPQGPKVDDCVLQADFLRWAPSYTGRPFNFIHCDFPYGIDLFSGPWSGKMTSTTYRDSEDTYWTLIKCLCANLDRLVAHSAHLMFWCAADIKIQWQTLEMFRKLAPALEFQTYPLVWHKSDNTGIMPDPRRGPRRTFETALIASREDRLVVKPVANSYAAPTNREHHPSTKPEPVLKHFFSMFVDENTRMLDPTCGGGSALRAAEYHGAPHVVGLELDAEFCQNARSALRSARAMKAMSRS